MKFFVVSAGNPEESYTDRNFERITTNNSYNLHENTRQKGAISKVSKGDILILKYNKKLVCYGQVKKHRKTKNEEFNLWIDVDYWVYHNKEDNSKGLSNYGIQKATLEGGQQGTIKLVKDEYALNRIKQINDKHQFFDYINKTYMMNENQLRILEIEKILNYKKQIILQGPPGTGKTRLAEELAKQITNSNSNSDLTPDVIKSKLKKGDKIANASGKAEYYTILEINDQTVDLQSDRSAVWSPSIKNIIFKYNQLLNNEKPSNKNGKEPYELAVAKHLYKIIDHINRQRENKYKIVQFHPSYTYEDFVRGITVENNDSDKLEYKTKNRILAEYASKALKNYKDSSKPTEVLSEEKWLDNTFKIFINDIAEKLGEDYINLSKKVQIINLDIDALRYKGAKGWSENGNRMLFDDIKQAYLDKNYNRQDIVQNKNLSGLANWHATYYFRVLDLFREFIRDNGLEFKHLEKEKVELQNFVLIIDEINRANLSSVLGELIYALEYRGDVVESMYAINEDREITLPSNLYIIGTMNTADRSVGHIDYAIRRRFAFVEILPEDISDNLEDKYDFAIDEFKKVKTLFVKEGTTWERSDYLSNEFEPKDVCIGHSYFIYKKGDEENKKMKMEYEVKPILEEYLKDGVLKTIPEDFFNKLF